MRHYGELPKVLNKYDLKATEMFFYQDMPIKLSGQIEPIVEERLNFLSDFIGAVVCEFIAEYGLDEYTKRNVYISAKNLFQTPGNSYNRPGYHSDGFMSDDINYIWYDKQPTVFNSSLFSITQDDSISMQEMESQAKVINEVTFANKRLLRLDQYNIHKCGECNEYGLRFFIKVTFSKTQFNLIGNAKNYLLNYDWEMNPRGIKRNIPFKKD